MNVPNEPEKDDIQVAETGIRHERSYRAPYPITTEAGVELWTYLNQHHGSATWGLAGDLIPQIEEEERERLIALLDVATYHRYKTHREGMSCDWCGLFGLMRTKGEYL